MDPVKLPNEIDRIAPELLPKIRDTWGKVNSAFMAFDFERKGLISRDSFALMLKKFNITLTLSEFNRLFNLFDLDKDGVICYSEFQKTVAESIHYRETGGVSLKLHTIDDEKAGKTTFIKNALRGRAKIALPDSVLWNNAYKQEIDSGKGIPLMKCIVEGRYYADPSGSESFLISVG